MSETAKFECNICIEVAKDPVVTRCGHLYWYFPSSWECIRVWLEQNRETLSCPVCKSGVTPETLIPLFTREEEEGSVAGPQRPRPEHLPPVRNANYNPFGNIGRVFGFTGRTEAPQVAAGFGYFPGVFSLAAVSANQSARVSREGNDQLQVLSKAMIVLGLLLLLAVFFV